MRGLKNRSLTVGDVVVVIKEHPYERHIKVTSEGIIIDIVDKKGEVVNTMSSMHDELCELPDDG